MKIFLKYVLKSMMEKKGRFLLILISVAMSTALVFASTGLIDLVIGSLIKPQLETFEERNIVIIPEDSTEPFFEADDFNYDGIKESSIIKEISMQGVIIEESTDPYKDDNRVYIRLYARDTKDMLGNVIQGNVQGMQGTQCAISERISKERDLSVGDTLEMTIAGQTEQLEVKAIYETNGKFYNDTDSLFNIYVPYEYLSKELGAEGKYNEILASATDEDNIEKCVEEFNESNDIFKATVLFDEDMVYEQIGYIQTILYVLLAVVVIMSAIIIYSTFKLIITERMKTIGTFLSQGATVGKVKSILYLEGLAYGIFGAIVGCGIGVLALNLINRAISPLSDYGIYDKPEIALTCYIVGVLFAIVLPIVSSYLPVRKLSKISVKNVILNDTRIVKKMKYKKMIIGLILLTASIVGYIYADDSVGTGVVLLLIALSMVGLIMAYPKILNILSKLLFRVLKGRSKTVLFAINNLRTSKVLLGNITLIIISLYSVITIQSAGSSLEDVVTKAYSTMDCDVVINNISTIRENEEISVYDDLVQYFRDYGIKEKDIINVDSVNGNVYTDEYPNGSYISIQCVDIDDFIDYLEYFDWDAPEYKQAVNDFKQNDGSIILTEAACKQYGLKKNDIITLECCGVKKDLLIAGVMDGILYNNGHFIIMDSQDAYDFYGFKMTSISIRSDKDTKELITDIKPKLKEIGASFVTIDELRDNNLEQNRYMISALNVFSYLAIVIAALGIINNISISFLQRKSEFAVLASAGMQNKSRNLILILESFLSVTWAMLIMTLFSSLGIGLISLLVQNSGMAFNIAINFSMFPVIYLVTLGIVIIATLPVLLKSKKLSIIEELKYE